MPMRPMADGGETPGRLAGADETDRLRVFTAHRALLFGVAYRLLGSVADAEDVVQESWLRWAGVEDAPVAHPRAFLVQVTTRLALDRLRRIKARREEYVGPWLPEPLLTGPDVAESVERAESVSLALLVVLESLSPLERAVFVLREAFGFSHEEIAAIVGRSEASVRQTAVRARAHVRQRRPRFTSDPATRRQVTERFLAACTSGELATLMGSLAPGVTLIGDGGGKARAPLRTIQGADPVARFLLAITRPDKVARFLTSIGREPRPELRGAVEEVNGGPGIVIRAGGTIIGVVVLEVADERVQSVLLIVNPDKLAGASPRHPPQQ